MAYIDTRRSLILEETVSRTAYMSRGVPAARARITVAVIGGGVMAAAVAHLLGQHPEFDITLFERDVAPGEATASNHGRMHSGGSSMLFDSPEITARKTAGLATFGAVGLDVFDTTETAAYAFEREAERAAFVTRAAWAGVAVDQRAGFDALTLDQFGPSIRHVVGLIEHATNFARVRSQLLARAEACGAELRFGSAVERVEAMAGNRMRLWSGDAALGAFDVVLNMAGRFAQNIRVDDHPPLDPKQQVRWPVFLTPLARLPGPNRVLTVIDAEHWIPSRIPHEPEGVVTFDCKAPALEVADDPAALRPLGPRAYNPADSQERRMMAKIRSVFPGLRTVADDDIGVFYGVHGRSPVAAGNPHHTPSDILAIHGHPGLPGYLEPSGGLATTAIRDAVEVAAEVARRTGLDPIAPAERLVWSMAIGASAGIRNHLGARARWQKALVA